jgi:hypothetical protein
MARQFSSFTQAAIAQSPEADVLTLPFGLDPEDPTADSWATELQH